MTITDLYLKIIEGIQLSLGYFLDPHKRIYFIFLCTSMLIAFAVYRSLKPSRSFFGYILNPKVWWGDSPKVDYLFLIFNGIFKVFAIGPFLIFGLYISFYTKEYLLNNCGYPTYRIANYLVVVLYTLTLFVVKDFSSYIVHLAFHKVPFLWRFHKVHHSATVLNPVTQYRIHPVELFVNNMKGILVFGLITGLFDFISNGELHLATVLGVNIFGFVFMVLGANLRHSHVKLKYPEWLESILISPVQHQIHHSQNPIHFDRNLGSVLAIWDLVFGTIVKSKKVGMIRFGLGRQENEKYRSFFQNLFPWR